MKRARLPWEEPRSVSYADKDAFKQQPGVRYSGEGGIWYVPIDLGGEAPAGFHHGGLFEGRERLRPYQAEGVDNAIEDGTGYLGQYDLGLGKTWLGFGIARALSARRVLIVCPSMVRYHWQKLAPEWRYDVALWESGKKNPEPLESPHLEIISYDSLGKLFEFERDEGFNLIVLDESHEIRNGGKGKLADAPRVVQNCYSIRDANPTAFRLCLTGTPIANRPMDLWSQLDWLWPGRFGTYWQFVKRYHEVERGEYGMVIGPVRQEHAPELRRRLAWVSQTVTTAEVAQDLPALAKPQVIRDTRTEEYLPSLEADPSKVMIFCFNRARVEQLAERFPEAIAFHGDQTPKKRYAAIEQANAEGRIVIATMDSAGTGIDNLAKRQITLFDQMAWTWGLLKQAMGRTRRLSSDKSFPTQYHFLVSNPHEERKIRVFLRKLKEIESFIPPGMDLGEFLERKYASVDFDAELEQLEFDSDWMVNDEMAG